VAELRCVWDKQFPGSINQVSVKDKDELAKWQRVCNLLIMSRMQLCCVAAPLLGTVPWLRWSRGSVLALVPKFAGLRLAEAVGFLGQKNPQHAFLRRGSKAVGPMS
jgi:hypothetical protein